MPRDVHPTHSTAEIEDGKRHALSYIDAIGRTQTVWGCARRGCDAINLGYESFAASDGRSYCLNHVPLRSRLRLWWQERRNG